MKTYKHKTLWWVTKPSDEIGCTYIIARHKDCTISNRTIPKELIENSQDREEVVKKDWIDDIIKDLQNNSRELDEESAKEIRQAIEENAPKVKKFTEQEIATMISRKDPIKSLYEFIIEIFADNWLLEE